MMMPHPCPSASRLLRPLFKSHNFFITEKWPVSEEFYVKVESLKFQQFYLMKFDFFPSFNFDLKFLWNWSFFHYEKIMRFKKWPQLPGAGRTRAGHHHGSHTPTSPGAILLSKMACQPKHIGRQCIRFIFNENICNFLILPSFTETEQHNSDTLSKFYKSP